MPWRCSVGNQEQSISSPVVAGTAVSLSCTSSVVDQPTAGVIVHNIAEQKHSHQIQGAHKGKISGLCFADSDRLLSCGVDCNIKLWDVSLQEQTSVSILTSFILFPTRLTVNLATETAERVRWKIILQVRTFVDQRGCPTHVIPYSSIDHHRTDALFATASNIVQIWDENKSISFAMSH
jgi:WD repeat and SOF domain-containing protein 1